MTATACKHKILVVEDEVIVARDIQMQLLELGYEPVGHVTSGEQAIDLAGQLLPDLVLMDIRLAGTLDGIAAAQVIRERHSLPVVFLSAFAEEDTLERAKLAEPFGYILKPFSTQELRTVLAIALYKHRAEAKLQISDTALNSISQGVVITDAGSLIVWVNEAFTSITGYTGKEVLGRNCNFLQGPLTDPEIVEEIRTALSSGAEFSGRIRNYRKDGDSFLNELTISPVRSAQSAINRFVGIIRDVTALEREEKARSALLQLSDAAHSASDMINLFKRIHEIIGEILQAENFYVALHDKASNLVSFPYFVDECDPVPKPHTLEEGRGLTDFVLRSGEPLLLSPATMDGMATHPDCALIGTSGIDWLGVPLKTNKGTVGVLTVQNYSGSVHYTEQDKYLLQFVSDQVAAAVERMQAQQSILESEERFHSLFDQSPIITCLLTFPEGVIVEINAVGVETLGFSIGEIVGRTSAELKIWSDLDERGRYLRLMRENGSVKDFAATMYRRDGGRLIMLCSSSLVTIGDQLFSLNSLQDITERERAGDLQRHYAAMLRLIASEAATATILESLAKFAELQIEGTLCSILQLSPNGQPSLHGAGPSLPTFLIQAATCPDVGLCGSATFSGSATIIEDVMVAPTWATWCELAAQAGLRSCWSQPILSSGDRVLGAVAFFRREPAVPAEWELALLQQSASLAAIALEREQLHEGRRLAKVVFEESVEGIMVTDAELRIIMVNSSFEQVTGFSPDEVVGQQPNILASAQYDSTFHQAMADEIASTGQWKGELWGRRKSNEVYPLSMSVTRVDDALGSPSHFISILTDISEQKLQAARIEQLAFYDSLTGLPNRALFLDRFEQTLAGSERSGGRGALLFMDLDRFKEINDSQGHAVGDLALAEVARRFQRASRKEETLARLGGDEFVLIAENADQEAAVRIASRLQLALEEPLELLGQAYQIGTSIGIALYPDDGRTSEDLIKRTDIAMYRAKASGGGYRFYQAEMGVELEKRLVIAKRLEQVLAAGELQLYYQPQIDLATGGVIGAEALLRWNDPTLGWISPAEFIPIAEERGMMGPLGDWVLAQACRQVNAWASAGLRLDGRIAVNVSAAQIEEPGIVGRLREIVHAAGLVPSLFELELTESGMMVDPDRAIEVMALLSDAGFGLSIDDFGTGYSSLAYLKRFAARQIKIDISFVRNMLTDTNDYAIVTTIIAMARSLGLKTTAEGVEEAGQAAALLALGCDFAQGYFFGRPEAPDVFMEKWLATSPAF